MKRRSFLSIVAGCYASCVVPPRIARRIHEVSTGASDPRVLAPAQFDLTLLAQENYGSYMLHLGDPEAEPDYPTMREYIESRGFYGGDDDSLRSYLEDTWFSGDESSKEVRQAVADLKLDLDNPIEGVERDQWMDWEYELRECTQAAAFRYLEALPLKDDQDASGSCLGSLSFIEGDRPGSNFTYVEADGLAAIASLQHRLNELQTGANIVIA